MKLGFERGALADLNEIFAYIAQNNPEGAPKLVARIEKAAARIAEMPYMAATTAVGRGVVSTMRTACS
jgi:plasmid stabilization system protein ParE